MIKAGDVTQDQRPIVELVVTDGMDDQMQQEVRGGGKAQDLLAGLAGDPALPVVRIIARIGQIGGVSGILLRNMQTGMDLHRDLPRGRPQWWQVIQKAHLGLRRPLVFGRPDQSTRNQDLEGPQGLGLRHEDIQVPQWPQPRLGIGVEGQKGAFEGLVGNPRLGQEAVDPHQFEPHLQCAPGGTFEARGQRLPDCRWNRQLGARPGQLPMQHRSQTVLADHPQNRLPIGRGQSGDR